MEWFKKFLSDNVFIIGFFIAASATWVIYEKEKSNNGLPKCTETRVENAFTNIVLADVYSMGLIAVKPEVYDFKSVSYDENANFCQATINLVIGGEAKVIQKYFKVYRTDPNSTTYTVGFLQPGD